MSRVQASLRYRAHRARTYLLAVGLAGTLSAVAQRDPQADSIAIEVIKSAFADIEANLQESERGEAADANALAEARQVLADGFDPEHADLAAAALTAAVRVASRMSRPAELREFIGELAYAYQPRDTLSDHLARYVLSLGSFEINRNNHTAAKVLLDSISTFDPARVPTFVLGRADYLRGYILYYRKDFEAAISYFAQAAEHFSRSPKRAVQAVSALDATASTNLELGHYAESLTYAERAVQGLEAMPVADQKGMAESFNVYLNYADALHANGRADEAYDAALRGLRIATERNDVSKIARSRMIIGGLHLEDGNYAQADQYLSFALDAFKERGEHYLVIHSLEKLIELRRNQGNLAEALRLQERKFTLQDSLTKESQAESIQTLVQAHEAEKVKQEIAMLRANTSALEADNERKRLYEYILGLALLLVTSAAAFIWSRLRLRKRSNELLEIMVAARTSELSEQTENLTRSNAELERFAYIASHDLKTPLRNVTSFLNLIQRRLPAEAKEQVDEYLDIALANARQMHHLVTDVLEFSKINTDLVKESETFDLGELARTIVEGMRPELSEKGARVLVAGKAAVTAPSAHVQQLLRNLIENGIKYNQSPMPTVEVDVRPDGSFVEVCVRDNGIGIAAEYHAHVFELFRRLHTTDQYDGTGVGLAVCKKVIERLGGSVDLESELGQGSRFTVRLPVDCSKVKRPMDMDESERHAVVMEHAAAA